MLIKKLNLKNYTVHFMVSLEQKCNKKLKNGKNNKKFNFCLTYLGENRRKICLLAYKTIQNRE